MKSSMVRVPEWSKRIEEVDNVVPSPLVNLVACRGRCLFSASLIRVSPQQEIRLLFLLGDAQLRRDAGCRVGMLPAQDDDWWYTADSRANLFLPVPFQRFFHRPIVHFERRVLILGLLPHQALPVP